MLSMAPTRLCRQTRILPALLRFRQLRMSCKPRLVENVDDGAHDSTHRERCRREQLPLCFLHLRRRGVLVGALRAGFSATAASVVSSRNVKVSCRYRRTAVSVWLK